MYIWFNMNKDNFHYIYRMQAWIYIILIVYDFWTTKNSLQNYYRRCPESATITEHRLPLTKTRLFEYIENFTTKNLKVFR